jgi:hypothetical protein
VVSLKRGVLGEETDDLIVPGNEEYVCARPMQSFGGAMRWCTKPSMSTNLTPPNSADYLPVASPLALINYHQNPMVSPGIKSRFI